MFRNIFKKDEKITSVTDEQLTEALINKDVECIKKYIAEKGDVNKEIYFAKLPAVRKDRYTYSSHLTLLMIPARLSNEDDDEIPRLLIEAGADINKKDQSGYTALHMAIMRGHTKYSKVIVEEKNCDLNVLAEYGYENWSGRLDRTPVGFAYEQKNLELLSAMINAHGPNLTYSTKSLMKKIYIDIEDQYKENIDNFFLALVEKLFAAGFNIHQRFSYKESTKTLGELLSHLALGQDLLKKELAQMDSIDLFSRPQVALVQSGPEQKIAQNFSYFYYYAVNDRADMLAHFYLKNPEMNFYHLENENDKRDYMKLYPYLEAVEGGCLESARFFLEHGADPHFRAGKGETPLHMAARTRNQAMVELLLEFGGYPLVFDANQRTPISSLYSHFGIGVTVEKRVKIFPILLNALKTDKEKSFLIEDYLRCKHVPEPLEVDMIMDAVSRYSVEETDKIITALHSVQAKSLLRDNSYKYQQANMSLVKIYFRQYESEKTVSYLDKIMTHGFESGDQAQWYIDFAFNEKIKVLDEYKESSFENVKCDVKTLLSVSDLLRSRADELSAKKHPRFFDKTIEVVNGFDQVKSAEYSVSLS
ncbi:MAG: ankyrin repeat domain-containing protein [Gammaproteobacteria bacterium]|nr:ankyrin repeat domain-containing protein [Gammaproteobacteria bacterium]